MTRSLEEIMGSRLDFSSDTYSLHRHHFSLLNTSRNLLQDKNDFTHLFPICYTSSSLTLINVTPSSQTVSANQFFTIHIYVTPGESIAGVQMEFIFNPDLIEVDSIMEGDLFHGYSNYFHPGVIDNVNGSIRGVFNVILSPQDGISTPGIFVTIKILSKNINGTSPLNLSNVVIGNPSALQAPHRITNGSVIISVQDSHLPEIANITVYHTQGNNFVNITCRAKDNHDIKTVHVFLTDPSFTNTNISMSRYGETDIYYLYLSYPNLGAYYFLIKAEDLSGNTQSSNLWIIYRFGLSQGWNLITNPLESNYTASSLSREIGDACDSIVRWNPLNQTYSPHPSGTTINDFPIIPGWGYFIHVWNTTLFTLSGHPSIPISISLSKGYNLIGWNHQRQVTADSLLGNISGCNTVSLWNPLTSSYLTYQGDNGIDSFIITNGDGIFVHLIQDTQWHQGN